MMTIGIYILLLCIAIITHWSWFSNLSILTSGDWGYQSAITLKEFLAFPQLWTNTSMGAVNVTASFYPFQLLYGLLANANFSYGLIERIVFMWPLVFFSVFSSYFLIKKNINSVIAAFIGSLIYAYNTYFLSIQTGHLTLMTAFALAPLGFLFFQKVLESKKMFYAVVSGLILFFISFYEFRAFYIIVFVLGFYYLYYQFILQRTTNKKTFIMTALYASLPLIIVGLLNLYWLLGFVNMGTLATNTIFSRSLFGNEFLNINYAFTLFHPFWTGGHTTDFIQQTIPIHFLLIPLAAILGLFLQRRNPYVLFFGIIALLGILLTKQVGQPFSGFYPWLYDNFPGFNAYREASKFFFLIVLGYSVLIAAFIDWIWKNWSKGKWKIYGKYAATILIAILTLWNTKPLITSEIQTLFVARHIPHDYEVLSSFINNQDTFSRTLWVPTYSRWATYTNNHPQVSAVDQINGSWQEITEAERKLDKYTEAELVIKNLQKPIADNLLDNSSIKYVIIPLRDTANDDDFFRFYGKNRDYYLKELNRISYLQRIDVGTDQVAVYENKNFLPYIFTTKQNLQLKSKVLLKEVPYQFNDATEYTITLNNVKEPFYLNFSESYHPQWKVRVGDFNWFAVLTNLNYFLPDDIHLKNEAYLNSYKIDPREICQKFDCVINKDGSYTMNITLYFKPQSYTYIGGIISLATFIVVLSFIGYSVIKFKKRYEKN